MSPCASGFLGASVGNGQQQAQADRKRHQGGSWHGGIPPRRYRSTQSSEWQLQRNGRRGKGPRSLGSSGDTAYLSIARSPSTSNAVSIWFVTIIVLAPSIKS